MYFNFKLTLSIGSTISEGGGVGGGYQRAPCEREKNIVCTGCPIDMLTRSDQILKIEKSHMSKSKPCFEILE